MPFKELVPILQSAIGPVILVSGVGLLLLSMTNRLARVVDRSRELVESLRAAPEPERRRLAPQLDILYTRARLLRATICWAMLSLLLAAVLVIALFLMALLHWEAGALGAALFIGCMASLIVSLLLFLQDINRSLAALKLELDSIDGRAGG